MFRNTLQRQRVRAAFARLQRPLSIGELRVQVEQVGIATLYRTVEGLLAEGYLERLEMPGRVTRYELAGRGCYAHFECRGCGRVYCLGSGSPPLVWAHEGFEVEGQAVFVYGLCNQCNPKE